MGVKSGRPLPGFAKRHSLFILLACFQDFRGGPPIPFGDFAEGPGVTFPAREATAGLINGKVIFWPGEMNCGDQSEKTVVSLFEGGLAGHRLSPFNLCEAASLRISLFDQIALHFSEILSHAISPLQETRRVWYTKE
jgi:hypothetical protein